MRMNWWAVGCLMAAQTVALAQAPRPQGQPPQTQPIQLGTPQTNGSPLPARPTSNQAPTVPALDPQNNPLDKFLLQWEKEMTGVDSLVASMSRTEVNLTFQQTDVYVGNAKYLKPNLAMLELQKKGNAEQFEKFICTGEFLYQYVPSQKEIRAIPMPKPKDGQVADNNFLTFLFGMKAAEAKRRYDLKLTKEDQYYVYIEVVPRFDADKADFMRARLVLNKSNFMPRQLWFEQPNKDTVTWDIPTVETKVALKKEEFVSPQTPQGWKFKQVPTNDLPGTPPAIVRGTKP